MFPIEQSSFLHALGYAIGHSLWQMPTLWLVYYMVVHIGTWPSNRRYALAVSMSVAGFGWFLLTLGHYATQLQVNETESSTIMLQQASETATIQKGFLFVYHSTMATLRSLAPYLSCAYLVVMMVLGVRLGFGFKQVKQLRSVGINKAAVDWRLFVDEHAKLLGIKRKVQVLVSSIATSPYTIGFFKPIILIPLASINHLNTQQMEAILLHELAHIRRHDYLLNIVLQIVEISLFFNPFMRLLLKQARLERENCCDDWVLQFRYKPADYARALLAIEKYSAQSLLAMGSNNNNEFELLNRVKRMVAPERQSFNYRQQLGLLLFITLLGLGFTVVVPRPATTSAKTEKLVSQPTTIAAKPATEPENQLVKTPAPALDLVKTLENIQHHIEKAVDSEEFQKTSERMQADAEVMAAQIVAESQPYIKEMEEAAQDFEMTGANKTLTEFDAVKYDAAIKNSLKIAELYANTNWEKIIGPALEQSGKALALIPTIFGRMEEADFTSNPNTPMPAAPATPPHALRLQLQKSQRQLEITQSNMQAKQNGRQRLIVSLGNLRKMVADSIKFAFRQAAVEMEGSQIPTRQTARQVRLAKPTAALKSAPNSATYDFAYNNNDAGNWNTDVKFSDEDDDSSDGDDNSDDNQIVITNKTPCAVTPPNTPKERMQSNRSTSTIVLNGKIINKKVSNDWIDVQGGWDQIWDDDKIQTELQQVKAEVQKGLKELGRLNIKTNVRTKNNHSSQVITIEVEEE